MKTMMKLSYTFIESKYEYDLLLDISSFPKLIQLTSFLCGIHYFVTVFGKQTFNSNIPFALHLTRNNLHYCFQHYDETKGINSYKRD